MSRTLASTRSSASGRIAMPNQAYSVFFNGTNTIASIASATGVSSLTSGITVGCWIKTPNIKRSGGGNFPQLYTIGGANGPFSFLYVNGNSIPVVYFHFYINGVLQNGPVHTSYTPNTWHHHVMDYDGTTIRAYTNGVQVMSAVSSGSITNITDSTIYVGANSAVGNQYWGTMCQFFVAPHLTATQIAAIAQAGRYPSGLVGLYPMNEGTGTTLNDISGNTNHLTLSNGAWSTDTPSLDRSLASARVTT